MSILIAAASELRLSRDEMSACRLIIAAPATPIRQPILDHRLAAARRPERSQGPAGPRAQSSCSKPSGCRRGGRQTMQFC